MNKITRNYQSTLSDRIKEKVKENCAKTWYADGVRMNNADFREWLKDLTMTRQQRFEKVMELKNNEQAN